jgi:hypothetical protein
MMDALKFSIWRVLVEAMTLTSVAALIALVGSVLLARSIAGLSSFESAASLPGSDKTLPGFDQLFTSRLPGRSY